MTKIEVCKCECKCRFVPLAGEPLCEPCKRGFHQGPVK